MPTDVFNNEAEQFTLAAILRNPASYYEINQVALSSDDFSNRDHRRIFAAVEDAVEQNQDPEIPYVIEYLKDEGFGSLSDYVGSLASVPSSVSQAVEYAKVVKNLSVSRSLGEIGAKIIDISAENRTDYNAAITQAEILLRSLTQKLPVNEHSPHVADILSRLESYYHVDSIPIQFSPTIQSLTGGMQKGHFWVVGGFSSTGKTAFACNIILDAIKAGKTVAVVSAEMTQAQYVIRMLAIESGVSLRDIQQRVTIGLTQQQAMVDAKKQLESAPLYVYDNLYRMPQIRTELTRLNYQQDVDLVVLDYIQNVSVTGDEIGDAREVALECQRLAKDLSCAVLAFSQISNQQAQFEMEGKDSDYYSLKGHGAIRDAADVILTLHRNRSKQSSLLEVKWRKNRHGPISNFFCDFHLPTGKIVENEWRVEVEDD